MSKFCPEKSKPSGGNGNTIILIENKRDAHFLNPKISSVEASVQDAQYSDHRASRNPSVDSYNYV